MSPRSFSLAVFGGMDFGGSPLGGGITANEKLRGDIIFKLYDTYGFPIELSKEEAFKRNIDLADNANEEVERLMTEQRLRSQTASKGVFKGGLGGQTETHKK